MKAPRIAVLIIFSELEDAAMATDIEKLVVQLSADVRGYQREMQKARGVNDRTFNAIRKKALDSSKAVEAAVTQAGRKLVGLFAVIGSARGAQELVDSATRIQNALKVAGLSGQELTAVYDKLFASAQRNAAPIEGLVTLYSRVSLAQKDLGVTSTQIVNLSDTVGKALRLSGSSAEESSGAMLQLSQALGGGTVQAEEYNSLIDGLPGLLQAAAAGLKEAGGSVSALTRLVKNGEISSKAFFAAIEAGSPLLDDKLAGSTETLSQKFIKLKNSLVDAARKFDEAEKASNAFGSVVDSVAAGVSSVSFAQFVSEIGTVISAFNQAVGAADTFFASVTNKGTAAGQIGFLDALTNKSGASNGGGMPGFMGGASGGENGISKWWRRYTEGTIRERERILSEVYSDPTKYGPQKPVNKGVDFQVPGSLQTFGVPAELSGSRIKQVSTKDFPVTASGKKGGGSGAKASADSRFNDDIQAVKDRTAALVEEQKIVGLSYEAQEKRRMALDLEQSALADLREEARKKGQTDLDSIKISDTQREKIDAASAAYAKQADVLRKLEDQQQRNEEAAAEFYDAFKSGAIGAITGAEDLGEALSNLASKFADLFLNAAFDSLFKPASGGTAGGPLGGIFSLLGGLLPGRANGGPVRKGQPYIVGERRPEMFVPDQGGRIVTKVPTLASMPAGGARGQTVNAPFAPRYKVKGKYEEIQQLRRDKAPDIAEQYSRTVQAVRKANSSGVKLGKFH
jgi:tape measure domain-containing protein